MENNYGKIFAEVLDIINNSEKEVKAKIPEKLYQQFEKNTDKSFAQAFLKRRAAAVKTRNR